MTAKLLIDECLHISLIEVAHAAGHLADHVNYLGLGGSKDWQLMATIRAQDYTFVTNNRSDFLSLHGQEPLHAGVVIIVPSVQPVPQRELFTAALNHIGRRDLTNTVVEVQHARMRREMTRLLLAPLSRRRKDRNEERESVAGNPFDEELVGPSSGAWGRAQGEAGRVAFFTTDGGTTALPSDGVLRTAKVLRVEFSSYPSTVKPAT